MKKATGVKRNWDSYVSIKKHKCPDCGSILKTVKVSKIIDSDDSKLDYNTYLVGPVKIISKEFECPNCGKHLTVEEMKKHEGIIGDKPLPEEEKQRKKEQNNVKTIIFTVLAGIVIFIIYSLLKS